LSSNVYSDDSGAFVFRHVAPGRYKISLEHDHSPTLDFPYAWRFYPQGKAEKEASIFEVHEGEKIEDLKFVLGKEVARRLVHVRVLWADGSPAENATAYLRDAHNPYSSVADRQTPTDEKGEAVLEGFVDTDYDVDANAECKKPSGARNVVKEIISASDKDALVTLHIKGSKCVLEDWQKKRNDDDE
jgi:hypothetical protein